MCHAMSAPSCSTRKPRALTLCGSPRRAAVLAVHGLVNTISTRLLAWVSTFSAAWHFLGTFLLVILLPTVAPTHQSAAFVFTEFQTDDLETTGEGLRLPGSCLVRKLVRILGCGLL